jgi:nucleoside-diphosphate-sugar epimerase
VRILVTGATGFVGAHASAALDRAGHEIVALVRDRARLDTTMRAVGVEGTDAVVGDMTDRGAVERALEGADAVVHCAAVVSLRRADEARMRRDNLAGFDAVVGTAVERGIDPVLHVSSTSALFRPGVGALTTSTEVGDVEGGYARSKADCERAARRLQQRGAPVRIVYPSGILGPAAGRALGETGTEVARFVSTGFIPTRRAALSVVDVRDLADVVVAVVGSVDGPRRVMCGGHLITMEDLAVLLRTATGRRFPVVPVPPWAMRATGRVVDAVRRVVPFESPISAEGMDLITRWRGTVDAELDQLGITLRDPAETVVTSVADWHRLGLVSARQAGLG